MTDTTAPTKSAVEKTPVTMTDGRVVGFGKKQRLIKTLTVTDDGAISLLMDFVNGETRTFVPRADLIAKFAGHGVSQKLGDEIVGETEIDDAVLAVDDLIARLNNGEWTLARQAGSMAGTSILIKALIEASGKPVEDVKSFLSNKSQAEKLALRRSAKLKPIVERLEAEKAATSTTKVDTDALLGELGLGGETKVKTKAE